MKGWRQYFHRTSTEAAESILRGGFRDAQDAYLTQNLYTGVWISDEVLDANEGAEGDAVLAFYLPPGRVNPWEWVEDIGYRSFLVPAEVINTHGRDLRLLTEEEVDEEETKRTLKIASKSPM